MSGSTIGSFVGAGIGFLIGGGPGAKIGWVAGGLIGGLIAPEKIYGPRLTDARSQTASNGVPRTYGYGTFPTGGNILWRDPRINEVETEEGGKGGGPKQITYTYTRSYAIGVCRGPIAGYLIIKRNGKIVWDARTDAELVALGYTSGQISESRAAQAKWLEVATLYYGDDGQMPDPTIQAVKGAGNVPAYRGSAYIVCTDDDVTDLQGAVPQYDFVVSACGTVTEEAAPGDERFLGSGRSPTGFRAVSRPLSYACEWVGSADDLITSTTSTTALSMTRYGDHMVSLVRIDAGTSMTRFADVDDLSTWATGPVPPTGASKGDFTVSGTRLFNWRPTSRTLNYIDAVNAGAFTVGPTTTGAGLGRPIAMAGNGVDILLCDANGSLWGSSDNGTTVAKRAELNFDLARDSMDVNGSRFVVAGDSKSTIYPVAYYTDDVGATATASTWPSGSPAGTPSNTRYCGGGRWLIAFLSTSTGQSALYRSSDNGESFVPVTLPKNLYFDNGRQSIAVDGASGRVVVAGVELTTGTNRFYYSDDLDEWTEVSLAGTDVTGITEIYPPSSYSAPVGTELPDAPGHYVDEDGVITGSAGTQVDRCLVTLGDIVEDQCAVRGVTTVDVSELTDDVDGFRVASETSPQRNIQALQVGYFFDGAEYDGVLHFPKRGAAASFALTEEDFVSRDGDPVEWEVTKENELLRKVTVGYIDPATTYTPTTQNWERRAGTIAAQGEGTVDLAVTGNKDWARQAAEKTIKAAWSETKECKFSVSIAHAALVTGQVGTIPSSGGGTHLIRITRIEDDGDVRHITAKKTQPNAYGSTATGVIINPPQFPGGGLSGPTVSAVMNLPVLRDADDKAGVYWAATGLLSSWPGAVLTLARNGVTFENGPQITVPCTMGVLTAALPTASRYALDTTNTLSVRLYPGARDLANASLDDLIETEANSAAILYADGTAEILQFTTRTVTGTREYDLTGLLRGRQDTAIATHADGAIFVLLDDNVRFAAIKASDVGKTLTFRAVSFGTVADSNPSQTLVMGTIESLREWSPYNVTVESDGVEAGEGEGAGYCVEWIGRARLGNSRAPAHSQWFAGYRVTFTSDGVTYDVDTTEQSYCADAAELRAAFGRYGEPAVTVRALSRIATNDDDFNSPPASPGTIPGVYSPQGAPASASLGPNGGYPDDAPFSIPTLTAFGVNLVPDGDFANAADLANWRVPGGAALPAEWTVADGALGYSGPGDSRAYCYPARYNLISDALRYTVTVRGDVKTDPGIQARIGVVTGRSSAGGGFPSNIYATQYSEYPESTSIEYSEVYGGSTGLDISNVMPALVVSGSAGGLAGVKFDNLEFEVSQISHPTTAETLTNIDFSSGLTGWSRIPSLAPGDANVTTSSGVLDFEPVLPNGTYTHFICDDPITLADAVGKYVKIGADVWSNDPTVFAGRTVNGVALGITYKLGGVYHYVPLLGTAYLRGDFTHRKAVSRIPTLPAGQTWHLCVSLKAAVGYRAKIRNITVEVTDAVVD